ncbi:MAG: CRISPR-associated endonuclease Cas2 [Patescibacteria group bacterium]
MKDKNKIAKIIFKSILIAGGIAILAVSPSPRLASTIIPNLIKLAFYKIRNKKEKKRFYDTFYYLRNKGLIKMEYEGKQLHISLTEEGKRKAEKYQIDDLEIKKPRKWDKRWRVLIFDIKDKQKIKRESLRGKIKELGLFQLQKSVWVCPYDFKKEMDMLRNFFNFKNSEMKVIDAYEIEDDEELKAFFGLNSKK